MKIFVRCTSCQKSLSVDSENEGKKARCPACGSIFEIRAQAQSDSTAQPTGNPSGYQNPNDPSVNDPSVHPYGSQAGYDPSSQYEHPAKEPLGPQQPGYGQSQPNPYVLQPTQSHYPTQTVRRSASTANDVAGWVSLSLGIVAIIIGGFSYLCCCFPIGFAGFAVGVGGLASGIFAKDQTLKITGIVLNAIAMLLNAGQLGIFLLQLGAASF